MEGYVYIKVGRRFNHTYAVLEGQQLQYYEKVDVNKQQFVGSRGVQSVRDTKIHIFEEAHRPYCLAIIYSDGVTTVFDCQLQQELDQWSSALHKAAQLHINKDRLKAKLNLYRHRLNFTADEVLTLAKIKMSFDSVASRCIDSRELAKLEEARNVLLDLEDWENQKRNSDIVDYEAVVEKQRGGGGLGLVVSENKVRGRLIVERVEPHVCIRGLTAEAQGRVQVGDILVGIDGENCTDWTLSRACARLGTLRLPPGYTATLTLERYVRRVGPPGFVPSARAAEITRQRNRVGGATSPAGSPFYSPPVSSPSTSSPHQQHMLSHAPRSPAHFQQRPFTTGVIPPSLARATAPLPSPPPLPLGPPPPLPLGPPPPQAAPLRSTPLSPVGPHSLSSLLPLTRVAMPTSSARSSPPSSGVPPANQSQLDALDVERASLEGVKQATEEMTKLRLQLARKALSDDLEKDRHIQRLESRMEDLEKALALQRLYVSMETARPKALSPPAVTPGEGGSMFDHERARQRGDREEQYRLRHQYQLEQQHQQYRHYYQPYYQQEQEQEEEEEEEEEVFYDAASDAEDDTFYDVEMSEQDQRPPDMSRVEALYHHMYRGGPRPY